MTTLADLKEEQVLEKILALLPPPEEGHLGPGDDCAFVPSSPADLLLKTDAVVGGVHFELAESPYRVGRKAIGRVLSDFAAMGGLPSQILITLALAPETPLTWLTELYRGLLAHRSAFPYEIIGGEMTSLAPGSAPIISVAGTGHLSDRLPITRSGAQVGDFILVTGTLGRSFQTGHHLDFIPRLPEGFWLAKQAFATAMMDLSDGLARDLPRLTRASGVGFSLNLDCLPARDHASIHNALEDGEDYELLFTLPPDKLGPLLQKWPFPEVPLTKIGICTADEVQDLGPGWQHFS